MGPEYRVIFKSFPVPVDGNRVFDDVLKQFDEHFEPKKLTKLYMRKFDSCRQLPNETINEYVARLREIAENCSFGDTLNDQLAKQISMGVRSTQLRDRLWAEDIPLDKLLEKCQLHEQRELTANLTATQEEAKVNSFARGRPRNRGQPQSKHPPRGNGPSKQDHKPQKSDGKAPSSKMINDCTRCGRSHPIRECPAYHEQCLKCGGKGHYARMCRKTGQGQSAKKIHQCEQVPNTVSNDCSNDQDDRFVFHTCTMHDTVGKSCNNLCCPIDITPTDTVHFRIDTQGEVTVLPFSVFNDLSSPPTMYKTDTIIRGFGGAIVKPVGKIKVNVNSKEGKSHVMHVEVVDKEVPAILSEKDSVALGYVKRIFETNDCTNACSVQSSYDLFNSYQSITEGVGCIPGLYTLNVDPHVNPVVHSPRPIAAALRNQVQDQLNGMEKDGIIEKVPVGEPSEWCSSLHVVLKKNKKDVRITIDPRDLNKALRREYHPIATIEDVITRTHGSRFFSVLDARQGYFQIQLDKDSSKLTMFNTPFGRYR